jgi:hypothetical protein
MTKPDFGQKSKCRTTVQLRALKPEDVIVKFRVELVWKEDDENAASSIYLTSDGRVILQGAAVMPAEREALALPLDGELISVDRRLIRAIKDML